MVAKKVEASGLDLEFFKPCKKADVPEVHKNGVISSLPNLAELRKVAKYVAEHGSSPYEAFDIADFVAIKKAKPELAKMKTLVSSFLMAARRVLKEYQVDKKLEIVSRKDRVYLVSME
jgi:hypothetical protein